MKNVFGIVMIMIAVSNLIGITLLVRTRDLEKRVKDLEATKPWITLENRSTQAMQLQLNYIITSEPFGSNDNRP